MAITCPVDSGCNRDGARIGASPIALLTLLLVFGQACRCRDQHTVKLPVEIALPPGGSDPRIWVASDGESLAAAQLRSRQDRDGSAELSREPVELFALRGETVAFQIGAQAGQNALRDVTVEVERFTRARAGQGRDDAEPSVQVDRFVVFELPMARRSGGKVSGESLGWEAGSAPPGPPPGGTLDDPLIPVQVAPSWASYPMQLASGQHRAIWIDVTVPSDRIDPGSYRSRVVVRHRRSDGGTGVLAEIPLAIEVGRARLPYASLRTMVFFDPGRIEATVGSKTAVRQFQQLMHAHHLSTIFPINRAADVEANAAALTGELFAAGHGYRGAGSGEGSSVVALGAYGSLGDPSPASIAAVADILAALERLGIRDQPGVLDVFLYAVDEQCESPRGQLWKHALANSQVPALRRLRVGHTCSEPPAAQAVDLVMVAASRYSPRLTDQAAVRGKHVWIYNGQLPQAGQFLSDGWRVGLRANAWIQSAFQIERWFYWESTFWDDDNRGGLGPHDVFAGAETFHNREGDFCNGDGVLVYPGRQPGFPTHSADFDGVFPSIRLKQWRRGVSDAGYLELGRAIDRERVERLIRTLVPGALDQARSGRSPAWATSAQAYEAARRELFGLVR
ncbi:MAG: hypothetical protein ABSF35_06860 [Polyangia bacterium]